ncbi:response regulator [Herminiimonas sp.]|uniref:response regulator n=1 Tax=Herminiimonas sp. TaxID=1926289 RepID=UPI00271B7D45|nr:response regulator [Herminiimonas sp.]MDO8305821.1 response regulator [Herminiimonas sp.]
MMQHVGEILLVEDDPGLRTMLRGMLELHDYVVSEAQQRETALHMLRANPAIRIVILDFGLPPHAHDITEGLATLKAIQSEIMAVKVIVLTGQDEEAAALEAIREGAFDFLAKPASSDTILRAIERAFLFLQKENELSLQGITRIAVNAQVADGLKGIRTDAEERLVRQILKETGFNVYQSAKRLGVKRENIYYFMKKFGIARDD